MTIRLRSTAALALVVPLLIAGCSGDGDGSEPGEPSSSVSPSSSSASVDTQENGAAAAGIDAHSAPQPIGSVTVPVGSDKVESSLAEVLTLEVRGTLLLGTFRVTPHGPGDEEVDAVAALGEFWTPELHDLSGLKRYTPVTDLRSSQWGVKAAPGEPMYLWAAWPVPEGAESVDIRVSSLAPPIEDVPLPGTEPPAKPASGSDPKTYEIAGVRGAMTEADLDRRTHDIRMRRPESLATASSDDGDQVLVLSSDILFAFDQASMPPAAAAPIAASVSALPRGAKVLVGGHTDALGTDARNLALSQGRAAAVAAAVRTARPDLVLTVKGFGRSQPVADNEKGGKDNPEGRAKNRRVELRYTGPKPVTKAPAPPSGSAGGANESPVDPGSPGIDLADPPTPLGSVTIAAPSKGVTSTVAELLQVRVKDGFVFGYFRVTPTTTTGAEPVDAVAALGEFWTPRLIDPTALTAYDTDVELRSNQWGTKSTSGKPMFLWAAWPVPPDARSVVVQISSRAPRFEDVPLP